MSPRARRTGTPNEANVERFAEACNALYAAMRRNRARLDAQAMQTETLSESQSQLLAPLIAHGPLTVGTLAELAGVTQPTATRSVKALEAIGAVTRTKHEGDDRRVMVELTDHGRKSWHDMRARLRTLQRTALESLRPETRAHVVEVLTELTEAILATSP